MIFANTVLIPDETGDLIALVSPIAGEASALPPSDMGMTLVKMVLTLIVFITLLFATFWFFRRLIQNRIHRGSGKQTIELLEKRMISAKTMLYLVRVENKKILFAESHLEVKALESFPIQEADPLCNKTI